MRNIKFIICLFIGLNSFASDFDVLWNAPEIRGVEGAKSVYSVRLTAAGPGNAKIVVRGQKVKIVKGDGEVSFVPVHQIFDLRLLAIADSNGKIDFSIKLPEAVVQLNLMVFAEIKNHMKKKAYNLEIHVDSEAIINEPIRGNIESKTPVDGEMVVVDTWPTKIDREKSESIAEQKVKEQVEETNLNAEIVKWPERKYPIQYSRRLSLGFGSPSISYAQDIRELALQGNAEVGGAAGVSTSVDFEWGVTNHTKVSVSYSGVVGKTPVNSQYSIGASRYFWKTWSLDLLSYRWGPFFLFNRHVYWGPSIGGQIHSFPFLIRPQPTEIEMATTNLTALTSGLHFSLPTQNWVFETFYRIMLPLNVGKQVELDSSFASEWSVSANYRLRPSLFLGALATGQSHKYIIRGGGDSNFSPVRGTMALSSTILEMRLGWSF